MIHGEIIWLKIKALLKRVVTKLKSVHVIMMENLKIESDHRAEKNI